MENNLYKTKLWKRILSVILAVIIGFGTFVTMTFSNVLLSDYVDLKSMFTANAATLNLVPVYLQTWRAYRSLQSRLFRQKKVTV